MADLLVSRIQNRRGSMVDLPQPLRAGELGWCLDTGRLYIGADETLTATGVQVFPGLFPTGQSLINTQMLEVDISGVAGFDIDVFKTFMADAANFPTVDAIITPVDPAILAEFVEYDADSDFAYIGLSVAQSAAKAAYITDIDAGFTGAASATPIFVVTSDGSFTTDTHGIANSISAIMNRLNDPNIIAITNLNVEVITEVSLAAEDLVYTPTAIALAASGTFISFPTPGIVFDLVSTDTYHIEYSIYGSDGIDDYVHMTGTLKISAHNIAQVSNVINEFIRTEDLTAPATIEFQTVITPDSVELQYKHDFPMSLTFKTVTRHWHSF